MKSASEAMGRHLNDWFGGHQVFALDPPADLADRVPGLQIVEVPAGPRFELCTYLTLGCFDAVGTNGEGREFVLTAAEPDAAHVESVAMAAAQHCGTPAGRLDRGSVVPLGRPWMPASACDRLLVTLPYPYGPAFEYVRWRRNTVQLLWLLPITPAEGAFVAVDGVEAFEARLEGMALSFTDPGRPSVI
ncbi:MAG TPA: suppressor of fused domain protein [Sporichthyaceae bacterium]|nr:suppressor of fused domain protein [Sporichthyaceae bacterium]